MTKVQRLIALIVIFLLISFGVILLIIRTTMKPNKSYWKGVGSWSLNIVGASTNPISLQYLIIGHNEPKINKYSFLWNYKYLLIGIGSMIMSHQKAYNDFYNISILSTLKKSFKEKNLSITFSTDLWKKTFPYGEASVKLVSNPVSWLDEAGGFGGFQGEYSSHHLFNISLKNNSKTPVRVIGLIQAGNYSIEKLHYIMPSPLNPLVSTPSDGNTVPQGGVFVLPGKSIMLYSTIAINNKLYRNIYFKPAILLTKNHLHGIQLVPATTWITYFG